MTRNVGFIPDRRARFLLVAVLVTFAAVAAACSKNDKEPATVLSAFSSPARAHDTGAGTLIVTDYRTGWVHNYSKLTGLSTYYFAVMGAPLAVAQAYDRVYVGNETTGSIEVHDLSGRFLFILGGIPGAVSSPSDIAVDVVKYRLFVVDGRRKNVKAFDLDGNLLAVITGPASGAGHLVNPTGVALDTVRQEIVVSDYGDPSLSYPAAIHIYTYGGAYRRSVAGSTGGFSRPQGLAVDNGHILLADSVLGQVLVFDSMSGALLKTLGSFGSLPGQLFLPLDVIVDPVAKDVYVTDNRNGRITVFKKGGVVP